MKIKFQRSAQQDLDDLIEYLTQRSGPRVAEKRLIRTYEALETIAQFPRGSQFHKKLDTFESWLPGTRYIIFYRVHEDQQLVVILAVIDHSRNTARNRRQLIKSRLKL
jgi:plasmid stabilization system protein ParE